MKTFSVTEDTTLKNFTDAVYPQGSFCLSALLKGRDVKINGVRVNKNTALKKGDTVVEKKLLRKDKYGGERRILKRVLKGKEDVL